MEQKRCNIGWKGRELIQEIERNPDQFLILKKQEAEDLLKERETNVAEGIIIFQVQTDSAENTQT